MVLKTSLLLSLTAALCLLQASQAASRRDDLLLKDDLFLDNLAEEDLKEEPTDSLEEDKKPEVVDKDDCTSPAARRNTDEYVDKVLAEVRPKLPEPAFLPERVGRFRLFNGTLENLISLKRIGPAMVRCSDNTFSFLVPIGLRNLTGKYFWETDAGVPKFRGFIDMVIGNAEADVLYTRRRSPADGEPRAHVQKLTITRLQGVRVEFDGLGPLNRVASGLTNLVARFFSRGVSRLLEGPVKTAINKELENVEKYEYYYF